jgi:cytochrome c-type biogenesis protein CcmH/NrfF
MKKHQFILSAFVCLLTLSLALAATSSAPAPAAAPPPEAKGAVTAEQMDRVKFDGLTPEQKTQAEAILNQNGCDCGCGMKAAECIVKDAKCGRSKDLGDQVVDLLKKGKSKDDIVKAVLTPPSKFVQFALVAGNSPSAGPKDAKVTILHYTDYQ